MCMTANKGLLKNSLGENLKLLNILFAVTSKIKLDLFLLFNLNYLKSKLLPGIYLFETAEWKLIQRVEFKNGYLNFI